MNKILELLALSNSQDLAIFSRYFVIVSCCDILQYILLYLMNNITYVRFISTIRCSISYHILSESHKLNFIPTLQVVHSTIVIYDLYRWVDIFTCIGVNLHFIRFIQYICMCIECSLLLVTIFITTSLQILWSRDCYNRLQFHLDTQN